MRAPYAMIPVLHVVFWLMHLGGHLGVLASSSSSSVPFSVAYPNCDEDFDLIGDGYCDVYHNNDECGYDGGDCCSCTCVDSADYTCGVEGYTCFDPTVSAACVEESESFIAPTEEPYTIVNYTQLFIDYPNCSDYGHIFFMGDGMCHDLNQNAECGYDGGDCCSCTCDVDAKFACGVIGYDCKDPTVSEACVEESEAYDPPIPSSDFPYIQELTMYGTVATTSLWASSTPDGDYSFAFNDFSYIFEEFSFTSEEYVQCFEAGGYVPYVGDGVCQPMNSNEWCEYDGGDCCSCTCVDTEDGACGEVGYDCQDPTVSSDCFEESESFIPFATSDDWEMYIIYPDCLRTGYPLFIGDGDCDSSNNNARCGYDGGDCCACTCVDTAVYTCGSQGGYDCQNPAASYACVEESAAFVSP